ncbi:DUF4846 domain-containing protein [Tenacibaculum sp.]|nr:DUF4846 domain-containing protein [Tenacibaculum sp.]
MKKLVLFAGVLLIIFFVFGNNKGKREIIKIINTFKKSSYINHKGSTVKSRIKVPSGYKRVSYSEGSFQNFIQNYKLKPWGSEIINYDGSKYVNQFGHIGILNISVPRNKLEQCADALIRLRAEFLWDSNKKNKIGFEFTSGDYCSWNKYAEGYRPQIKGNKVTFHKTMTANYSKSNFYKYLTLIYTYAGTLSLYNELSKVTSLEDLEIGDMLVNPGTPGHVVMLVDEVMNSNGQKLFVLAQGNTPAQNIHLLKNPRNISSSPWYRLKMKEYIEVPGYHFDNAQFIRFKN